jgi:hypothetical protein
MRKAINENPVVQISVLGVGLVLVGFLLFTRMSGGKEAETVPPNQPIGADATGAVPADPAATGAAPAGTASAGTIDPATGAAVPATPGATAAAGSVDPQAMQKPGPGLPREVVDAWKRDDAVVLLVIRPSGIDDKLVEQSSKALSSDPNVALFVTPAEKVAKYSRITQPIGLNRVPALVVVRPKDIAGAPPQAQVSYGFRSSQSVVQAVRDALYKGKDDVPYYPG